MLLKRYPYRPRYEQQRPDPNYGLGYRPDWPSILSVAHDEADGGRLFVVTDRPCVLIPPSPGPVALPLAVGGLAVVAAAEVLPNKFVVTMNGPVPRGAAWAWESGASSLIDPVSGHAPNAASGTCADVPGPYAPPAQATVIAATPSPDGTLATLTFDRPVALAGPPPYPFDDGLLIGGFPPVEVTRTAPAALAFTPDKALEPGAAWSLTAQPTWIATPLALPQDGIF